MKQVLLSAEQELFKEKQSIIELVNSRLRGIMVYNANEIIPEKVVESASRKEAKFVLVVGGILLVTGFITRTTFISIIGAIGLVAGWWMLRKKEEHVKASHVPVVDLSAESQRIFADVKEMHQTVIAQWDRALSKQSIELKNGIVTSSLDSEIASKIYDILASHAVISFSMMDVLQELMAIARSGSNGSFKDYLEGLRVRYESAINAAYFEQNQKYSRIMELL